MVRKGISNLAVVRHSAEKHDAFSVHVIFSAVDRQFEPWNMSQFDGRTLKPSNVGTLRCVGFTGREKVSWSVYGPGLSFKNILL